jgi:hypothetical protein
MLSKDLIIEAIRYNTRAISNGSIDVNVLPSPFCDECSPIEFVAWTYSIQLEKGMHADGKLDPELFSLVRTDERTVDFKIPSQI